MSMKKTKYLKIEYFETIENKIVRKICHVT